MVTGRTRITRCPEARELIVERTLAASRERVWLAWTRPEHLTQWWGPHGWTATVHEMDVRPDGIWRYSLAPDDGVGDVVRGRATYRVVSRPGRLEYVDTFADERWRSIVGSNTETVITIAAVTSGTHLTIATRFASAEQLADAEAMGLVAGLEQAFERLDQYCTNHDQ